MQGNDKFRFILMVRTILKFHFFSGRMYGKKTC